MDELPDDLRQLEEELIASRSPGPSPEFRDRVLGGVQHELAVELQASRRQSRWAFVAAVAASVLVWMNLSISATTVTGDDVRLAATADVDRLAGEIHELLPELSETEARRQAFLLRSRHTLVLAPKLPPPSFTQRPHGSFDRLSE